MAIPKFEDTMLPTLKAVGEGKARAKDIVKAVSDEFGLSDEEREVLIPSKRKTKIKDRVDWSINYLFQAGLLSRVSRGHYQLTDDGRRVLKEPPTKIDRQFLLQFEGFQHFVNRGTTPSDEPVVSEESDRAMAPEEQIDSAYTEMSGFLKKALLDKILAASPEFFEELVITLLVKMGYGGSFEEAGKHLGKPGDQGVDGIINQDRLGLDTIYIQAKRYTDRTVGSGEIREFVGALDLKRGSNKGVLLTTSRFANDAEKHLENATKQVVLIDGDRLTSLMLEYDVGVRPDRKIELKKIEDDFFEEDI